MIIMNGAAELTCPWCSHTASFQVNPQHADEDISLHCRKCSKFSAHKVAHPVFDSHNKKLKESREVWKRIPPDAYVTCRQSSQGTAWTYTIYLGKGVPEEFSTRDPLEHMMIKEFGMTWEQVNAAILSAGLTPGQKVYFQRLTKISAEVAERMEKTAEPDHYRQGQSVRVAGLDGLFLRYSPEPGFAIVAFPGIGDQEVPVIEFEVMDTGNSPEELGFDVDPLEHGLEEGAEAMGAGDIVEEIENAAAAVDQMLQHETQEGESDEAGERDLLEKALEELEEAKDDLMDFSIDEAEEAEELFEDDGFSADEDEEPEFELEQKEEKHEAAFHSVAPIYYKGWLLTEGNGIHGAQATKNSVRMRARTTDELRIMIDLRGDSNVSTMGSLHNIAGRDFPHPKQCAGCQKKHRGTGAYCKDCGNQRKAWWNKAPWEIDEMTRNEEPADTSEEADLDPEADDPDNWVPREDKQYPEYAKDLEKGKEKKEANRDAQRRVHTHYGHSGDLKRAIVVNLDDLSVRDIREVLAFYANTGKIDSNATAAIASEFIGDRSVRRLSSKVADIQTDECVNCGKSGKVDDRGRCDKCGRGNTHTAVDADDNGYGTSAGGQECEQCGQTITAGSTCPSCSENSQNVSARRHQAMLEFGLGIFQPALYKGKEVLVLAIDNTGSRVTVQDAKKRMFTVDAADLSPTKTGPYTRKPR